MDAKKLVIVLLVIAIVFSVGSIVMNLSDGGFASNSYVKENGQPAPSGVSVTVLPNLILGVLNGL